MYRVQRVKWPGSVDVATYMNEGKHHSLYTTMTLLYFTQGWLSGNVVGIRTNEPKKIMVRNSKNEMLPKYILYVVTVTPPKSYLGVNNK